MAIRNSNDPAIGAIMQNLAGLFAPTSPQDLAAYAATAKAKQEAEIARAAEQRLSSLYAGAGGDPDMQGAILDLWDPTNGLKARDMEDATKRYGYDQGLAGQKYSANASAGAQRYGHDRDYAASTENNYRDNQGRLLVESMKPIGEGEISRGMSFELGSLFGVPEIAPLAGPEKPLTQDQYLTKNVLPNLPADQLAAIVFGNTPIENIVGETGKPVVSTRLNALGKTPYVTPGSEAKPTLGVAMLPDGTRVAAEWGPNGWQNAQTKMPLPADIQIADVPKAVGTAADIGMGLTTGTQTQLQPEIIAYDIADAEINGLREKIARTSGAMGAVGWAQRNLQNLARAGDEAAIALQGEVAAIIRQAQADGVDAGLIERDFNDDLSAIQTAQNKVKWAVASAMAKGGRLSNEMLQQAEETLGFGGILSNDMDVLARLDDTQRSLRERRQITVNALKNGVGGVVESGTPVGTIEDGYRFKGGDEADAANWEPVQ